MSKESTLQVPNSEVIQSVDEFFCYAKNSSKTQTPKFLPTAMAIFNFQILLLYSSLSIFFCFLFPQTHSLYFNLTNIGPRHQNVNITTFGDAYISSQGLQVTPDERSSNFYQRGKAIYIDRLHLWDKSIRNLTDFYTHFVFVIDSAGNLSFADGLTFFLAPDGSNFTAGGAMGLPIDPVTLLPTSPFVAVEFDTFQNREVDPVNISPVTHVGIDVNSLQSNVTAVWYCNVADGIENEAWIRYDSSSHNLSVVFTGSTNTTRVEDTIHLIVDLRDYLPEWVTFGFSAATGGKFEKTSVISWEFSSSLQINNGTNENVTDPLDPRPKIFPLGALVGIVVGSVVLVGGFGLWKRMRDIVLNIGRYTYRPVRRLRYGYVLRQYAKRIIRYICFPRCIAISVSPDVSFDTISRDVSFDTLVPDTRSHGWKFLRKIINRARANEKSEFEVEMSIKDEFESGSRLMKFSFSELCRATNYFEDEQKLGEGGFGGFYRGFLREWNSYIAVKRISKGSKQGVKGYATEVKIISRLMHRNLVQLIGWCPEKKELLLVYEFVKNGSLNFHLFKGKSLLTWETRYKIAQDLASALLYLHEDGEHCVVHRDIKSSNVMLDSNFNAKLGDFGLDRFVDHEKESQTTVLLGSMGYLAPECLVTGKANKESDVYSFGVVALEIACGRKPFDLKVLECQMGMVEWVWDLYGMGRLLEAADPKIGPDFDEREMQQLMILGLWCAHPDHNFRPKIRQVIHVLDFEAPLPILPQKMPALSMHSSMASSSNSEFRVLYDIFLSFRGLDTRKKFTDHLYKALKQEGFETFRDDDEIERGEDIKSELRKAIWNSRLSVIVLSKNYACSTACLFEIQTILEHRKKSSDHLILPVFYEVDPAEIKEQARNLAFGKKKVTVDEVKGWSAALKEVASMAGMVSQNQCGGYEAKFIEEIVGVLKRKLTGARPRPTDYLESQEHEKNMQTLKIKLEYLRAQENDINVEISSAESQPRKRRKKEVEVWLGDVQRLKDDSQILEKEVLGERKVVPRALLGKHILKKIQEVQELQERGRVFNGLLVDELQIGRLLIPLTKDFVYSTEAMNKDNIWECLMNEDLRKIGVHGMGGVGKTTIMKHIHNLLLEETGKFDSVFWVTVSKAFNITTLQRDIDRELNLSLSDVEDEAKRASELYAVLSRKKRYVLILDDLWEAFSLERVGIPEPTKSNGCKLVLTTRSLEVCRRMECKAVKVELLTEQEALTLFLSMAVGHDTKLAPEVEEIATEVAKECACLPLAIVTVAGSMRGLNGKRDWRNALNELISSTKDAIDGESEVFERLKFSYSRLGNKVLQDCFLYCSLYPEDHDIPVKELIEYWIAEGFIADLSSVEAKFDKGHAILRKLTSTSLLERFTDDYQDSVRVHDLIRDMALRITQSSPRFMVKSGVGLGSVPYEEWSEDLERISLMYNIIEEFPTRPPDCPRLTTLLLTQNRLSEIPDSFFTYIRGLEVLDLSDNMIKSLPESISNLENLHAIILVGCHSLEYVPSLEKMKALKVFKLTHSRINEAPKGMEELVNLRELDLSNNLRLEMFPGSVLHRLSKLQCLQVEGTPVEVLAKDLVCLTELKVVAIRLHNIPELTGYVTSQQFQGLEKYCLAVGRHISLFEEGNGVCIKIDELCRSGIDQLVLPNNITSSRLWGCHDIISLSSIPWLKDARHVGIFTVSGCDGLESIFSSSSFSQDGQISLRTVESFHLSHLPSCRVLFDGIAPPCNISFNLKRLSFQRCNSVKNIFPAQLLQNFPNLEALRVGRCKNVEDIIAGEEEMSDSNTATLPRLRELHLFSLPRLKSIYTGILVCESVELIRVWDCPMIRRLPLSLHINNDQARPPPALNYIKGEQKWWESLRWDDPLTKTILEPFFRKEALKKMEFKLDLHDDKRKQKAIKTVSGLNGVLSVLMKNEILTVTGDDAMDAVMVYARLMKRFNTEILTVGPA